MIHAESLLFFQSRDNVNQSCSTLRRRFICKTNVSVYFCYEVTYIDVCMYMNVHVHRCIMNFHVDYSSGYWRMTSFNTFHIRKRIWNANEQNTIWAWKNCLILLLIPLIFIGENGLRKPYVVRWELNYFKRMK